METGEGSGMKRTCRCRVAVLIAMLLALYMVPAWAEAEADGAPLEEAVEEYAALELTGAQEDIPTEEVSEALDAELARATYYDEMVIDEMLYISDEVWSGVKLKRSKDYRGKLALVQGSLVLDDVLIEGAAAENLSLDEWFELAPGASISCAPGNYLSLNKSALCLDKDKSVTLSPLMGNVEVAAKKAKWSSSNSKVASVSSRGVVKGRKKGTAIITAKYNGDVAACSVVVNEVILPKKIKLNKSSLTLGLDGTQQLEYTISPADADIVLVSWSSSKPGVVSVDDHGFITALSTGEAKITAATSNGKKATCKVKVKDIKPTGIKFSTSSVTMEVGEEYVSTIKLTPSGAAFRNIQFTSSDEGVAYVDDSGVIYAVDAGTATITAACAKVKGTLKVTVRGTSWSRDISPTAVRFAVSSVNMKVGDEYPSTVRITPSNATDQALSYTSSNENVAWVDGDGVIYALEKGTATITASSVAKPNVRGTMKVTVTGTGTGYESDNEIKPTSLKFKKQSVSMKAGDTFQLTLTISPKNVTNAQISLSSSDENVAWVDDQTGIVYAVEKGKATITATCEAAPRVRATCEINVIGSNRNADYGDLRGTGDLTGLIIGINPGHQHKTIKEHYPIAPGSSKTAKGVKTGASGKSTHQNEYEVVLDIGLKLKRILEEHGADVVITRTDNEVMLTNIDRAMMLNEAGVDVALQLHNNSCSNSSKTGVSGYIRTTGDWVEESRAIAECLCRGMAKNTPFTNLGVKIENEFMSLNWTTTPSVLLEMGYLSNRSDDKLLALDETREGLAWGIYEGLCEYFGR